MAPIELRASDRHASALCFTSDGKQLLTGGMKGAFRAWNVKDWTLDQEIPATTSRSRTSTAAMPRRSSRR